MVPVHLMAGAQAEQTKSIAKRFRDAGATEPGKVIAWTPESKVDAINHRKLAEKGALVEMRPGMWYLNEEKLAASGGGPGIVVVLLLGFAALAVSVMLLLRG